MHSSSSDHIINSCLFCVGPHEMRAWLQVLPGFVVAPLFFQGKIELGVVSETIDRFTFSCLSSSASSLQASAETTSVHLRCR